MIPAATVYFYPKVLVLGALASSLLASADANPRPTVTLHSGVVVGTTTELSSATAAVDKYIGIPYAASPPERFSPPSPHASWTKPLDAVETKAACLQQFNYPKAYRNRAMRIFNSPEGPPPAESEDCLYLNVYVPPRTKPCDKKTVMFWIYGGDLQFGDAGLDVYDGSSFAYNQDVVLVTHNYRTNVFGYPNSPEIANEDQNAGFLDQRFALQWVQENIESFGGSPEKITIFGQSAGGYSIKQLVALPPNPVPFRAAIIESEAALFAGNGTVSWETLAKVMECEQVSSPLKCLRSKPAKAIKSTIEHHGLEFPPVANEITSTSDIRPAFSAGTAAKIPLVIGTVKDEGRAFTYALGIDNDGITFSKILEIFLAGEISTQDDLKTLYSARSDSAYIFISDLVTNSTFLCPTSLISSIATGHNYDVYRYFFNASFPNTATFPNSGVYHASEVPEVFGTYPRPGSTTQEIKLSKYMQTAWANFAKDPHGGPGWPLYGTEGNLANLGGITVNGEKTMLAKDIDTSCDIYDSAIREKGV